MLTISIRKNEPVEKAIRRLKKRVDREGVLKIVRQKAYYEKPSEKRIRKRKAARRNAVRIRKMGTLRFQTNEFRSER
ncbi:MAG: 30S ribosomal protein S21 [Chlamydiae bacterium]|nr:MAG: 30S ribosomal protein S21 [Chlamydiota bacterium]